MKRFHGNHGLSMLMMLSLVVTLNGSQATVLCVGSDGHVAIEPAGHDHCADGTHICESDADVHHTDLAAGTDSARCPGCTDLALAGEVCNDPTASGTLKIVPWLLVSGCWLSMEQRTINTEQLTTLMSTSASGPLPHIPLSSIVLQV